MEQLVILPNGNVFSVADSYSIVSIGCEDVNIQSLVRLRLSHPVVGASVLFMAVFDTKRLFQVERTSSESVFSKCTMVLDDSTVLQSSIFVLTLFNPLFLVLPVVRKHKDAFKPLSNVFEEDMLTLLSKEYYSIDQLRQICDVNEEFVSDGLILVKYNQGKTINWLRKLYFKVLHVIYTKERDDFAVQEKNKVSRDFQFSSKEIIDVKEKSSKTGCKKVEKRSVKQAYAYLSEIVAADLLQLLFAALSEEKTPEHGTSFGWVHQICRNEKNLTNLLDRTETRKAENSSTVANGGFYRDSMLVEHEPEKLSKEAQLMSRKKQRMADEKRKITERVKMKSISAFFKK